MYLVLIETSGNQNYIFSTNKLKENIGASELTYRAGTQWVIEAVDQVRGASEQIHQVGRWVEEAIDEAKRTLTSHEIRSKLLDTDVWNRPIESSGVKVEVVIATSGKALLLTKDRDVAKAIIRYVTHKATRYAPGLDISGAISKFDWQNTWTSKEEAQGIARSNKQVHHEFELLRSQKPSPLSRFLQLPVVDQCATSGLPAAQVDSIDNKVISQVANSKGKISEQGFNRIKRLLEDNQSSIRLFNSVNGLQKQFEEELDWLAVIHADGNGLGEIFLNFWKYAKGDRDYINKYRSFSIALDICTEQAFLKALTAIPPIQQTKNKKQLDKTSAIPLVPLILGGDDLTVICAGRYALPFVHKFLQEFEWWTSKEIPNEMTDLRNHKKVIPEIAELALSVKRLSSCAGIAIVKSHFPTSVAYDLSEKLMKSAKKVKERVFTPDETDNQKPIPYPCSALDFHVLYDSSDVDLDKIRSKLKPKENGDKVYLFNRPYIVTSQADLKSAPKGTKWAEFHRWEILKENVEILLTENEEGRRRLPNSQMHDLRAGLFLGKQAADARYRLIRDRYISDNPQEKDIRVFEGDPGSLFQKEPESGIYMTRLLDAIDGADFLGIGEQKQ